MKLSTSTHLMLTLLLMIIHKLLGIVCSEKLVIDTDGGADDAAAILLAWTAWMNNDSNFEVVGITCVNGNAAEPNVEVNVLKTITVANASDIRIYGGAKKPLVEQPFTDYYFGKDGLGDFVFDEQIKGKVDKSTYASVALIELAKKYPRKLNVLCLGPLTNIAIAAALDPSFMNNVKRFYVMGGTVAGVGNKSPGVEFNFASDPESNFMVLNGTRDCATQDPILLYPWETVLNAEIEKSWRIYKLGSVDSPIVRFLNRAESKSLKDSSKFWTSADLQATAVMIWPHLSLKSIVTNVTPVIDGAARGSVLVDYRNKSGKPKNCEIVQQLDAKQFQKKVLFNFS